MALPQLSSTFQLLNLSTLQPAVRAESGRASGAIPAVEPIAGFALRMHDGEDVEAVGFPGVENRIGKAPDKSTADAIAKFHPKVGEISGQSDGRLDFFQE